MRTAVNQTSFVIPRRSLRPMVCDRQAIDRDLADTQRRYLAQVRFKHQSIRTNFVWWKLLKELIQLASRCDKDLSSTAIAKCFLYADRTTAQHTCRRNAGITGAEHAVPWQHHRAYSLCEHRGPSFWADRRRRDKPVCNRFRLHERMRDDTTKEVMQRANAEAQRLIQH